MAKIFSTGNSTVAKLAVGSILEVVGKGQLEVIEEVVERPEPGDRIDTKYGPATVVGVSSRLQVSGWDDENEVLYVADDQPVVRRFVF